jgi:S1-C subfamily serine protease
VFFQLIFSFIQYDSFWEKSNNLNYDSLQEEIFSHSMAGGNMKITGIKKALLAVTVLFVMTGCGFIPNFTERIERFTENPNLPEMPDLPDMPDLPEMPRLPEIEIVPPRESTNEINPSNPFALEQAYIDVYDRVSPSVVHIRVVLGSQADQMPEVPELPGFPPFDGEIIPNQSQGSGFVYDRQGHIITNNHVVAGANRIIVTYSDGTEAAAELVGTDPDSDLAVIKVDTDSALLVPVPLGDSSTARVGQIVVAIGNPFGLQNSLTTGVISGLGRLLPTGIISTGGRYSIPNIIQTDTAINPGNSGGPLLTLQGEVVGVNTAITSATGSSSGVGYAVPSNIVARVVPELIENGSVQHPWLGISGQSLNTDLAIAMNLDPQQRGVLVSTVVAGSPADNAGLLPSNNTAIIDGLEVQIGGDIITGINDRNVRVFDDLLGFIFSSSVGDRVTLTILRDGEQQTIELALDARPKE